MNRPTMLHATILALLALLQVWNVSAQFNFFDQMFGGHPGHQQQQQQQRPAGASYYAAQADSGAICLQIHLIAFHLILWVVIVPCNDYLCPGTLVCVRGPSECPCPDVQDVQCAIPDPIEKGAATVICVRGQNECSDVEKLLRAYAK